MKIPRCPHSWSVTPSEAIALQRRLADRVVPRGRLRRIRLVAGADLAFERDRAVCIAGVHRQFSLYTLIVSFNPFSIVHTGCHPKVFILLPSMAYRKS